MFEYTIQIRALAPENWVDFEELFGARGVYGCWWMWWRVSRPEFEHMVGDGNQRAMKQIVFPSK